MSSGPQSPEGLCSRIKAKEEDYQETTREGSYIALQRCGIEDLRPRSGTGLLHTEAPWCQWKESSWAKSPRCVLKERKAQWLGMCPEGCKSTPPLGTHLSRPASGALSALGDRCSGCRGRPLCQGCWCIGAEPLSERVCASVYKAILPSKEEQNHHLSHPVIT